MLKVIPWNASALEIAPEIAKDIKIEPDYFTRKGEIIYGYENTFAIDVKFKADRPGFVVQHIQKQVFDHDKLQIVENIEYWEIFYISPDEKFEDPKDKSIYYLSENADSFKYGKKEKEPLIQKGHYIQIGTSEFYPYDNSDGSVQFREGIMLSSPNLKKFFGDSVDFDNTDTPANGLPYSKTKITVNHLLMSGPNLERTVVASWNHYIGKDIELIEKFRYIDPISGDITPYWDLDKDRFDYEKHLSSQEKIKLANRLRKHIYKDDKLFVKPRSKMNLQTANDLLDYLTTAQFVQDDDEETEGGNKKYKKKSIKKKSKKFKNKTKRVKSRKKKI